MRLIALLAFGFEYGLIACYARDHDFAMQGQMPGLARTSAENQETDSRDAMRKAGRRSCPAAPEAPAGDWIGSMKDSVKIVGDIVSSASDESDGAALRD